MRQVPYTASGVRLTQTPDAVTGLRLLAGPASTTSRQPRRSHLLLCRGDDAAATPSPDPRTRAHRDAGRGARGRREPHLMGAPASDRAARPVVAGQVHRRRPPGVLEPLISHPRIIRTVQGTPRGRDHELHETRIPQPAAASRKLDQSLVREVHLFQGENSPGYSSATASSAGRYLSTNRSTRSRKSARTPGTAAGVTTMPSRSGSIVTIASSPSSSPTASHDSEGIETTAPLPVRKISHPQVTSS